ncbi:MAG: MarR family transcriptional regulator [Chloroflexota bacterium]
MYFNVNTFSRKVNRIWKDAFKEVGLSPSHAYLLRLVLAEPGLSQKTIADILNLEKSTVTRFINKLETEGFIIRQVPAARNTREQTIYPTKKAQLLHSELGRISDNLHAKMLETIGIDEIKELVKDLRKAGHSI